MSEEHIELFYRGYDALNRRDLEAFLEFMDPEVELMTRFMELEGEPYYRGHDGVRQWWDGLFAVFPDFSGEVLEVREQDDFLIASVRVRGHGAEGGAPFEQVLWQVARFRDGKATWWRNFGSEAEALRAVG